MEGSAFKRRKNSVENGSVSLARAERGKRGVSIPFCLSSAGALASVLQKTLDLSCACVFTAMRDGERRESLDQTGRGDLCRPKGGKARHLRRRSLDRDCMQALSRAPSQIAATDKELSIVALGIV